MRIHLAEANMVRMFLMTGVAIVLTVITVTVAIGTLPSRGVEPLQVSLRN